MKRYRVAASRSVLGHKPGEEFEAAIDKAHEARLLARGSLERVQPKPRPTPEPKPGSVFPPATIDTKEKTDG